MVRITGVFIAVLVAFILGTYPILEKIVDRWLKFDEAYSHGLLILGVSLFLIARVWPELKPKLGFHWAWFLALIALCVTYAAAGMLYVEAVQQVLLLPILLISIATLAGWHTMWRLLLPIGVLVFAIPFWDYLSWPLQLITTEINSILLGLWDIEFKIEGVLVFLPGVGAFEIAHGCSGLRYVLVALSLATIYSEMNYRLWRNRILLFCFALFIALLTNWIRVFVIIYQGYVTNMESSLVNEHDFFGWALFAVALIPVFFIANKLERTTMAAQPKPDVSHAATKSRPTNLKLAISTTLVVLVLIAPVGVYAVRGPGGEIENNFNLSLEGLDGWQALFQRMSTVWEPAYSGADFNNNRIWFQASAEQVEEMPEAFASAHVLTYAHQSVGKELIHDSNRLVDTSIWRPTGSVTLEVAGRTLAGLEATHWQTGENVFVIYGFYVGGHWSNDAVKAKLLQLYSLFSGRQDASLVAVAVQCETCEVADITEAWAATVFEQAEQALDRRYGEPGPFQQSSANDL